MNLQLKEDYLDLRKKIMVKDFSRMNPMQREAVFCVNGPVLILAGAGSGKTTVLVNRVANMVKYGDAFHSTYMPEYITEDDLALMRSYLNGGEASYEEIVRLCAINPIRAYQILTITFTNKAAGELKERLSNMLPDQAQDIMACTFHSLCVRILRREIERLGFNKNFTIYDTDDSVRVIKDCLKRLNIDEKSFTPKSLVSAVGRVKDDLISPDEYTEQAQNDYRSKLIAKIYREYQASLKNAQALDFDDIIYYTVKLFETNPEVLEYYQNRYRYIMVDEYQDTNHAQYRLISLLSRKHKNLCVVGDDDQSIYKFRGATIENILSFENQFENVMVIRLEQNYRSTQTILDAANSVIANNLERKGKNLWTDNGKGEKVYSFRGTDEFAEAAFVAKTIEHNVENGAKYSDHAILYRMNAQSNSLENYFVRASIPYKIIGGLRFFERKEIKDILAYLCVINNQADSVRLKRIINEPKRGIGDTTVAAAEEISRTLGVSLFEVMETADQYQPLSRKSAALMEFAKMIRGLAGGLEGTPLDIFYDAVLQNTGYMDYMRSLGDEGITRIENLNELQSNLIKYEEQNEAADLSGFLEEVALFTDLDSYDGEQDNVVMMTMHSAKGLEFPYVFIIGMEEGIFPGMQSMYDPAQIEEERRLAYVGLTRAKKQLYVTSAASRLLFGSTQKNKTSRFLREIPQELIESEDMTLAVRHASSSELHTHGQKGSSNGSTLGISGGKTAASRQTAAPAPLQYGAGDRVHHGIFGEGMVLSVTPMGGDYLVEIAFDTKGTKKIMANFAKLTKL